ncbi:MULTISPECIES: ABC transporter permease subunit [unclassified Mycolicibacterium]|uniref:ABC transporter permease n=1 Tax=unclassified Mycolicibacterium TaxID=2636767 RepID=UPI0012DCFF88|nr:MULTISPECIES: ABC transporter permease subunit [unclassified Mycolicibacterium]MUL81136.1 ABC transporter permease [Mycolicibacterium sp. CBMA 329]MUL86902.1 ABC transporter permease [Mycolicibacterium sp. CBMA 331]MUM30138.1 ABC transporter permease [Mycolicibacterium sp. CBMA 295]MUM37199.1 ABC transporter permease [Mycolicibacterium sp. CBMA 247]MUM42967.1 ABC transporter permease [Mycolicibacterium sp. CBMA 294]
MSVVTLDVSPPRKAAAGGGMRGGWTAVVPLLLFATVALGLPTAAMVVGALTSPAADVGGLTFANMRATLDEPYLTSLVTSVKLSAICAVVGTVIGLPVAQAVVTSRFTALREAVLAGAGVLANFGGVPLAFAFVATLGNAGVLTGLLHLDDLGWSLYGLSGLVLVYLYFLIPLMVLSLTPALEGLTPQWREAAANNGATTIQYWRYVALPVLTPSLIGGFVLLFGTAFSTYATAAAMVGSSVPLVTVQIAAGLSGDVLVGQGNVALALALDMVLVAAVVMAIHGPLRRRSARWLG